MPKNSALPSIAFLSIVPCITLLGCTASKPVTPQATPILEVPKTAAARAEAQEHELGKFAPYIRQKSGAHKPVVALVLGSGGARGYAHIGAIRVLEANGIQPDFIVGTSAGSMVGALYASGKTASQMQTIAEGIKSSDVRDITLSRQGFFNSKKIESYVNQQVQQKPIEQLKIPLFIVATELATGSRAVFNYGNTGQAVSASISIPSMFVPAIIDKKQYVDGGLVSPVPVEVAKGLGADVIIAVNILAQPENTATTNMWGLFNQNINVMQNRLASYELKAADVVIQPNIKEKQHIFSLDSRSQTMLAGEQATMFQLDKIRYVITQAQQRLNQTSSFNPSGSTPVAQIQ